MTTNYQNLKAAYEAALANEDHYAINAIGCAIDGLKATERVVETIHHTEELFVTADRREAVELGMFLLDAGIAYTIAAEEGNTVIYVAVERLAAATVVRADFQCGGDDGDEYESCDDCLTYPCSCLCAHGDGH